MQSIQTHEKKLERSQKGKQIRRERHRRLPQISTSPDPVSLHPSPSKELMEFWTGQTPSFRQAYSRLL